MKQIFARTFLALLFLIGIISVLSAPKASATFNPNLLFDDVVFDNVNSMSPSQIDAFLNQFPSSCISSNSGFSAIDPTGYNPTDGFLYGNHVTAGRVIYDAAQAYGLNPQVIIVTLEKEQSLITGRNDFNGYCNNGDQHKYAAAMGYGCPDSITLHDYSGIDLYQRNGVAVTSVTATCVNTMPRAGFTQQIISGTWLLRFGEQRSEGNVGWAVVKPSWDNSDDLPVCYTGAMTEGTFARGPASCGTTTFYDGYTTIDNTAIHMDTGPTAALYLYTPHFPGNQDAVNIFTSWFGGTISSTYYSCHNATNIAAAPTGESIIPNHLSINSPDYLSLVVPNNTATACIEVHTWNGSNYSQWIQHTATNAPAVDPGVSQVVAADLTGSGRDLLYRVDYTSTGSGMIEVHGWDSAELHWLSHVATNRPVINPNDARVIAADLNGDGKDELYLIQYRNTASGMVEVHGWSPNLQQWTSHIATNLGAIDPNQGIIIAADLNGDGKDELVYVKFANAQSGAVEFHVWTPDLQRWAAHTASVLPTIGYDPAKDGIIAIRTVNNTQDQIALIKYSGTDSGTVEIHGMTPSLQSWSSHIATNQAAF